MSYFITKIAILRETSIYQKALFNSTPDDDIIDYDHFPFLRNDDNSNESPPNPQGSILPQNMVNIDQESEGNNKEQDHQIKDGTGKDNGKLKKIPFITATSKHPLQSQKRILVNTKRKNPSTRKMPNSSGSTKYF
jgi:hypothetical protein